MPTVCAVYGCTNKTTNKSVSFYRFPKKKKSAATDLQKLQEDQRNMWLKSLHRVDLKNKQVDAMRICSSHFKSGKDLYNLIVKCVLVFCMYLFL